MSPLLDRLLHEVKTLAATGHPSSDLPAKGVAILKMKLCSLNDKRIFWTEDYFGVGPSQLEPGDTIALLAGVSIPYVIRACGENFQLIGPAYTYGIMYGEAWPEDESVLEELTLV